MFLYLGTMTPKNDVARRAEDWALRERLGDEPTKSEQSGLIEKLDIHPDEVIKP